MRDFILNWKDCKDKEDREYCLGDSQDNIIGFVMFGSKKNKHYEENKAKLYKIMSDEKFVKTCKRMSKKSSLVDLSPNFITVILDFLENNKDCDETIVDTYMKVAKKVSARKIEDLKKKVDLPEPLIFVTFGTMPDKDLVNNPKVMSKFINKALNRLYSYASAMPIEDVNDISTEELKMLMKKVFGKDALCRVLLTISLEGVNIAERLNDSGKVLYSKFTELFLNEIQDYKKGDIKDFFEIYIDQRKRAESYGRDYKRRIDFTALVDENKYDRLLSIVKDIKESDDAKYIK